MTGDKLTVVKTTGDELTGDELTVAENARNVDMLAGGLGFIEETAGEVQGKVSEDLAGGRIRQNYSFKNPFIIVIFNGILNIP